MTNCDALLRAMADAPEDDIVRLAYADWLEENGDPDRADFVRIQMELSRIGPNDPDRREWVVRHARHLKQNVPRWKAELPQLPGIEWGDFHRGLVEEVQAQNEDAIIAHAVKIFAEPAVHVIRLRRLVDGRALAGHPHLSRVRALRMVSAWATADALQDLFASWHWGRVLALDLHGNQTDDEVAANLADGRFPDLTELWLGWSLVGNSGGRALAASPHLSHLRFLDLRSTRVTDPTVRAALTRRFGSGVKFSPGGLR